MRVTDALLRKNGILGVYDTRRQWFWKFEILMGYFWNLVPDRQCEHLQQTQKNAKCDEYVLLESKTGLLKDNKMLFVVDKRKEKKCSL